MEFILIVDEHGIIKYSSSIELRDTPVAGLPEINKYTLDINHRSGSGLSQISADGNYIIGIYPLEYISHPESYSKRDHSYLFARFDLIQTLNLLRYRQQQEIVQTTIIHFGMLLTGFLLLYLGMRNRIKSIISGIRLFSEGDYSTRIHLFGQDEFSKISRGFDDMAVKLQTQNQNLLDLTDQLWAQHEELVLQEQDLRVTLNSIGDAVIATNADGLITRMNPVAQKLSGWNISDATGRPITEVFRIIDASTRQPIENPIEKVIKTGETVYLSNNTTLISRDGSEYQISDSAAPIRDEDNKKKKKKMIF
ncbi:MAG: PAS domain-containing protein, partial [Gammaproteobacteria bacterium]